MIIERKSVSVIGLQARTNNVAEKDINTAKIMPLWQQVNSLLENEAEPANEIESLVKYGVYSDYDSDDQGDYSITVAVDSQHEALLQGQPVVRLYLPEGRYYRFCPEPGALMSVETVISVWQQVWAFFGSSDQPLQRAYLMDYEVYHPNGSFEIFISIQD